MPTELKFKPNYNGGYTKEVDLASVKAANILVSFDLFDRVVMKNYQIVAEKYFVGNDFKRLTLYIDIPRWGNDPYQVTQTWYLNGKETTAEIALSELSPKDAMKIAFNLDTLSSREIDLNEYDKCGKNY